MAIKTAESSRKGAKGNLSRIRGTPRGGPTDIPFVCTKQELALALRVTPRHIENLTRRRLIRATRLGRSVRYTRASVLTALEKFGGAS
jgi:excisionase family DNA binding protein